MGQAESFLVTARLKENQSDVAMAPYIYPDQIN